MIGIKPPLSEGLRMSLPTTRQEILLDLYNLSIEDPGAQRIYRGLDASNPETVRLIHEIEALEDEGLVELTKAADMTIISASIEPRGRAKVERHGWHRPIAEGRAPVNVKIQGNDRVKVAVLELDAPGRRVDGWQLLLEGILDQAGIEYRSPFDENRGRPVVVLKFASGMPDGDVEATAMELGAEMVDVLVRARTVQAAEALYDLETREKALRNAESHIRAFLSTAQDGTELAVKGTGLLQAIRELGSVFGIGG